LRGNEEPLPGIPKVDKMDVRHFFDESEAAEGNSAAKVRSQEPTLRLKSQMFRSHLSLPACLAEAIPL
jgi:hypothetical protein